VGDTFSGLPFSVSDKIGIKKVPRLSRIYEKKDKRGRGE
jgi:hypothetical protein